MSRNSGLLACAYTFTVKVNDNEAGAENSLLRLIEGDRLMFQLKLTEENAERAVKASSARLYTDIFSGSWEYRSFEKLDDGVFGLNLSVERPGTAFYRFAVETDSGLLWEPDEYHQILTDPQEMGQLCLYTLIPRAVGTISEWTKKLDEISAMGFNAVHILPFTQMSASESPYAASDLFKIDAVYAGGVDDFRHFASRAAELGIMICLDIVLNHVGNDNVICSEHADWLIPDKKRPDGMKRAGCYHNNSWISWEDLVLINYQHPVLSVRSEIYNYMLDYVLFWLDAAGSGKAMIRLDNLHSSDKDFIRWIIPKIRDRYPGIIIFSEFFGAEEKLDEAVMDFGLNLLTANTWEYPFVPVLEHYISNIHTGGGAAKYLLTPVSHDTESAAELFGGAESSIPRYAVCSLMGTGATGIVQGFETGTPAKVVFIGKEKTEIPDTDSDFRTFIARVNSLMKSEKCLRQKGNIEFLDTDNDSLIVCIRKSCTGGGIIIAVNLDIHNSHGFTYRSCGQVETLLIENADVSWNAADDVLQLRLDACGACAVRTVK